VSVIRIPETLTFLPHASVLIHRDQGNPWMIQQQGGIWTDKSVYYVGDPITIHWSRMASVGGGGYLEFNGPYSFTGQLDLAENVNAGQYFAGYAESRGIGNWVVSLYIAVCSDYPPITCSQPDFYGSTSYQVVGPSCQYGHRRRGRSL